MKEKDVCRARHEKHLTSFERHQPGVVRMMSIKENQEIKGNLFTFLEKNETTFHCKLLDNCEKSRGQKRENAERARCLPGEA